MGYYGAATSQARGGRTFLAERASANLRASIWRVPSACRAMIGLSAQHIKLAAGVTVDFLGAVARARAAHRPLGRL